MTTKVVELGSSAKFTWKIENFSKLNAQEGTLSDVFTVGSFQWQVRIYPKGRGKVYDHLSLFLIAVDSTNLPYVECSFTLTSQTDRRNRVKVDSKHKFTETCSWGYPSYITLRDLHDPAKGYIVNDTCVIRINLSCRMNEEPIEDDE